MAVATAEEVKRRREHDLLRIRGVVGVGVGSRDGDSCINVYVEEDTPAVRAAVPREIEGVATQIIVAGQFRAL